MGSPGDGAASTRNQIARLENDGSLDSSFDPNLNGAVRSIVRATGSNILIGGNFTSVGGLAQNYIAEIDSSGNRVNTFNPNPSGPVFAIVVQADNQILIGGNFLNVSSTTRNFLARLSTSGSLDTTFDVQLGSWVNSFVQQSSGKILLGGNFTCIGGGNFSCNSPAVVRNRIARFNSPGGGGGGGGGSDSGGGGSNDSGSSDSGSTTTPPATPATPTPAPQSTGAVAFVPTSENPGLVSALVGGNSVTPIVVPLGKNETIIRAGGVKLSIKGASSAARKGSTKRSVLVITLGRLLVIAGDGAQPNSIIQQAIFSSPVSLTSTTANANGEFLATSTIPAQVKPGNHTLQVTGRTKTGEPFVLSVGVVVARASTTSNAIFKFRPASAGLTMRAKASLRKLVFQSKGKQIKQARIDGKTFSIAADFARELARERVAAISTQLRKLGVNQKIQKRVVPTNDVKDRQVRTYEVSLRVS